MSCEKEQVQILAERVDDVLDQFAAEAAVPGPEDNGPLATPIEDEFRVATPSLAWDPNRAVIVIEAFDADILEATEDELGETGEEPTEVPADFLESMASRQSVRVVLSPPQARSFVRRARALVSPGVHHARSAADRSTRPATSARGPTVTSAAPMDGPRSAARSKWSSRR